MFKYHVMALCTALVWGSTLIASKKLILAGLVPAEIMTCRFILGYVFLFLLYPKVHKVKSWTDELIFFAMGFFGGSLYFLLENSALYYTHASNIALITSTVPIFTALMTHFTVKGESLTGRFAVGSAVAFAGVALIIFNGNFILKLSPMGDLLAFGSVVCWAIYCVVQKFFVGKYNALYITRSCFFYGLLTIIPYFIFVKPFDFPLEGFAQPVVFGNLLYLGLVASAVCFSTWNTAIDKLGVIKTNVYVYLLPLVTIVASYFFLDERLTVFSAAGAVLIIFGLWYSERVKQ